MRSAPLKVSEKETVILNLRNALDELQLQLRKKDEELGRSTGQISSEISRVSDRFTQDLSRLQREHSAALNLKDAALAELRSKIAAQTHLLPVVQEKVGTLETLLTEKQALLLEKQESIKNLGILSEEQKRELESKFSREKTLLGDELKHLAGLLREEKNQSAQISERLNLSRNETQALQIQIQGAHWPAREDSDRAHREVLGRAPTEDRGE